MFYYRLGKEASCSKSLQNHQCYSADQANSRKKRNNNYHVTEQILVHAWTTKTRTSTKTRKRTRLVSEIRILDAGRNFSSLHLQLCRPLIKAANLFDLSNFEKAIECFPLATILYKCYFIQEFQVYIQHSGDAIVILSMVASVKI